MDTKEQEEHPKQFKMADWKDYGRCHLCKSLAVEDLGYIGKPQYYCRVCKTHYVKYSQ